MCQILYIAKAITLKIKGKTATSQMKVWLSIVDIKLIKGVGKEVTKVHFFHT